LVQHLDDFRTRDELDVAGSKIVLACRDLFPALTREVNVVENRG